MVNSDRADEVWYVCPVVASEELKGVERCLEIDNSGVLSEGRNKPHG